MNYKQKPVFASNHHGLQVRKANPHSELVKLVMAHMLWEDQFYMDGKASAELLKSVITQCDPEFVAKTAIVAREMFKLRHVPLLLARELARTGALRAAALEAVIQRPDEIGEFLALYWKDGKQPVSNQVKKGLAAALLKFNEYQLAKWDKNSASVSLRDVLFLTHAKPTNPTQEALFKRLANQELKTPDTWEVQLSAGADKRATFERLMSEKALGGLAFIRNLRNMEQAGVNRGQILAYSESVDVSRILPFRFLAAARTAPSFKNALEQMMLRALAGMKKLPGRTLLMVDCSGSMHGKKVSGKSDLDRFDAAASLAMLCKELCEDVEIFGFSDNAVRVGNVHRGFNLVDAIRRSCHGGTSIGRSLRTAAACSGRVDRVIIFTDEESSDTPVKVSGCNKHYIINVAAYKNGLNLKDWVTITGFSEAVFNFIQMFEEISLND